MFLYLIVMQQQPKDLFLSNVKKQILNSQYVFYSYQTQIWKTTLYSKAKLYK